MIKHCVCGSSNVKYKYLNNKKAEQPRYRCMDCKKMFTVGDHNRPKPGHYTKTRNKDPDEFRGLDTQCAYCFVVNLAKFKYYNNKPKYGKTQPRFVCLACDRQFQMRFEGNKLVCGKTKPGKAKPDTGETKPGKTKWSRTAPQSAQATTSASEYDVVDAEHVYEFSNTEDETFFEASDPMEHSDGLYTEEMEAATTIPFHVPNVDAASASDYAVTGHAGQSDQVFYTNDQVFCDALQAPVEQSDVGKYLSAYEYGMVNAEQVPVDQFSNTYFVPEQQGDVGQYYGMVNAPVEQFSDTYCVPVQQSSDVGQCSSAYEYGVVNAEQVPVEQFSNTDCVPVQQSADVGQYSQTEEMMAAAAIPFDVPNYQTTSACEYEVVNAEQEEQLSYTDAGPVEQSDVGQCRYFEEMAAATTIPFPVPEDDALFYSMEYSEDNPDQFMREDAVSFWD